MAVERQNITMYVDSNQWIEFVVEDVDTLAGAHIRWKMAALGAHALPVITKTSDDVEEIAIVGTRFTVYILPADNAGLSPGRYYHEARITDEHGHSRPVTSGFVLVQDTITPSG